MVPPCCHLLRPMRVQEKKKKKRKEEQLDDLATVARTRRGATMHVLDVDAVAVYRPKTAETARAYEGLLSLIHEQFGEQPQVRTCGTCACVAVLGTGWRDTWRHAHGGRERAWEPLSARGRVAHSVLASCAEHHHTSPCLFEA